MKSIKRMFYGVCALFIASIAAPVNAGEINLNDPFNVSGGGASGSLGGPYIAIQGAMNGSSLDGSGSNSNGEKLNDASLGKAFGSIGVNVGWTLPISDVVLIGLDLNFQPGSGKIKVDTGAGDTDTTGEDIDVTMKDTKSISLMPMFALSDNSAFYIKAGITHADLSWNDEMVTGLNSSMIAETLAVGSRTLIGEHGFIQTEFGYSGFDTLNIHTVTSNSVGTADPESVYGSFSIGVRY